MKTIYNFLRQGAIIDLNLLGDNEGDNDESRERSSFCVRTFNENLISQNSCRVINAICNANKKGKSVLPNISVSCSTNIQVMESGRFLKLACFKCLNITLHFYILLLKRYQCLALSQSKLCLQRLCFCISPFVRKKYTA